MKPKQEAPRGPEMARSSTKRLKSAAVDGGGEGDPLLPGLPDHLAQLCLSPAPPRILFSVCRSWRRLLYSPYFPPFLSLYALLTDNQSDVAFASFDPLSATWHPLPSPPLHRRLLLRHPAFIGRSLPIQSAVAAGRLVLLAATAGPSLLPALPSPLAFHPESSRWLAAPALPHPRRWCAAGTAAGRLYLASGVGFNYRADVARSAARWDPLGSDGWEAVAPLPDGRFSREAIDAVGSGGKLCVADAKTKEGAVYDAGKDRWEEMPAGMLAGWTGPAAAAEAGGPIYAVDEAAGELRAYDWERDAWRAVVRSERLKGAVQVAAGGGRVCVACGGGGSSVVVVDVTAPSTAEKPARMWVVEPPDGKRVLAVHVLPRMTRG